MKANANLEFLNRVREVNKSMLNLANFWLDNEEALKDVSDCKNNFSRESFRDLALNVNNWHLAVISNYCKKLKNK